MLHSPNQAADAVAFAKLLCGEGSGKEGGAAEYFQAQAHNLMTGLLLTVLTSDAFEQDRTLRALRSLTSLSETDLKARLKDIVSESPIRMVRETLAPFVGMADKRSPGSLRRSPRIRNGCRWNPTRRWLPGHRSRLRICPAACSMSSSKSPARS